MNRLVPHEVRQRRKPDDSNKSESRAVPTFVERKSGVASPIARAFKTGQIGPSTLSMALLKTLETSGFYPHVVPAGT
jgi:hypothetical protein